MKRILVIGISGSGKTRFAKRLGETLGIPVFHLDSVFWKENWQERSEKLVRHDIASILEKDSWITEGYIEPLSKQRLSVADTVIYLDYPGRQAVLGGLSRSIKHWRKPRPEMPDGNTDRQGLGFYKSLLHRDERLEIEKAIMEHEHKTIRLRSRRQARDYLETVKKRGRLG